MGSPPGHSRRVQGALGAISDKPHAPEFAGEFPPALIGAKSAPPGGERMLTADTRARTGADDRAIIRHGHSDRAGEAALDGCVQLSFIGFHAGIIPQVARARGRGAFAVPRKNCAVYRIDPPGPLQGSIAVGRF